MKASGVGGTCSRMVGRSARVRLGARSLGVWLGVAALLGGCGGTAGDPASSAHRDQSKRAPGGTVAAPKAPVKLTVEVNGDLLIHSPVWQTALQYGHGRYDFSPMLREIAPYIRGADLAICHVETPMTPRPPTGYPVFNTPPALAKRDQEGGLADL